MPWAERKIMVLTRQGETDASDYLAALEISWNSRFGSAGHRDILGSLMGLGIVRESLGDIAVEKERAVVFMLPDMAKYVEGQLDRVGRTSVRVRALSLDGLNLEEPALDQQVITAASLRLDALLSAALKSSRSKIAAMIASGQIKVNHEPVYRSDIRLTEDDLLSIRGWGRIRIHEVCGETKKDRMRVVIDRYRKRE
ncbi:YlmH/Sll1252 family protein [Gehongia tenuis]|uniref:Photosystem II S4 domain protein n=1 Tax=Gehongia tenuis TaxID=2763655 RepID=A0A926D6B3_9FIRM|nr:photosystem II S4 domain protein [Gehongia tenuis]